MVPLDALGRSTRKPGSVICGKWRIEAHLRSTATSATYSAIHRNGARIALKILHGHLSTDKTLQARFRREAYVANTIPHPDTVKVIDDDETDDGCALLVMDHFDGETLEELRVRKGGKLPVDTATAFIDQLLDIIAAAHDQGVVHRDIKPETVFVTKQGKIKVHDFGTARVLHESSSPQEMTAAGMVVGSPSSMAPEQARGQRDLVDAQSDVFSLGALLFLLISGEQVHNISNPLAALVAAAKSKARSLRTVTGNDVSDAIVEVVDRALSFQKVDRWPDARAFRAALRAAKGELIDTFPQAGRRDPLADLMGDTSENPLLGEDGDVPMQAGSRPEPPQANVPDSTLMLSSPYSRAPHTPAAAPPGPTSVPRPPGMPAAPHAPHPSREAPASASAHGPVMAARVPKAPASSPTGQTAPTAPMPSGSADSSAVGGGRDWQSRDAYDDAEDGPTLARSPLDPELVAALADVRRGNVGMSPSRDIPRVTPSSPASPPRPGTPSSPPRPGGPPRPGVAPTAPKAPPVPQNENGADKAPRAPVVAKLARPSGPPGPSSPPSAPARAMPPGVASHRDDGKDPRFATVVMAGSPGEDRPKLQRPSFDLPPADEQTMVDLPAMPPSAPEVHAAVVVGRAPQAPANPANPQGFGYMQPPAYPQQQPPMSGMGMGAGMGGRPGFDMPPMRPPVGSSGGLRAPTPFEVFQTPPPAPHMPSGMQVPHGEFPGRRLSMHEDLRILVPEQSLALDQNPFADAAKRRKRITIGVVVGIVVVVIAALLLMARSG